MSTQLESPEVAAKLAQDAGEDDSEAYRFGRPPDALPYYKPAAPTRLSETSAITIDVLDLAKSAHRRRFINMPNALYVGEPNYIAPLWIHQNKFLDPAKNPAFESITVTAFMAVQGGKDVGRMTAQIDANYNEYHESKTGFLGFFECVNERAVAHALFTHGIEWLLGKGIEEVFGPTHFTLNHQAGLLVENFDRPPFVEETYNPSYYEELFVSFGFAKAKDLLVWWVDITEGMTGKKRARIARICERIKKREGITIRNVDMKNLDVEFEHIFELYNACWQKNWGFAPMPRKEFMWLLQDLKDVAIPELIMFVEVKGRTVGFCATLPNVNERLPKDGRLLPLAWTKLLFGGIKKCKEARLYTLGVMPEYRKRGLEALIFSESLVRAHKLGITGGEIGWTLDDNTLINRAIESMDGTLDRRYRVLGMNLGTAPD